MGNASRRTHLIGGALRPRRRTRLEATIYQVLADLGGATAWSAEAVAPDVAWLVRPLGGDVGVEAVGDGVEAWVNVPRA